jgi:biopolymer transport protein ExbB
MSGKTLTWILTAAVMTALVFGVAGAALAQEGGEDLQAGAVTVGQILQNAGIVGYLIIFLSIVGVSLIIEHFVSIRRDKLAPPEIVDELETLLEEQNYQEAMELCEAEHNPLTNVVAAALPKISSGFDAIESSLADVGEEEAVKLHQKISWISLIGATSPMWGLLGTVLGMMKSFNIIAAKKGAADPSDLASGISEALVTTMLGLFVAIPMMSFFFYFRNKVIKITLEIGAILEELFERFRPQTT